MSYLVLARRWRPQKFHDLVGQDVVIRTLQNAFTSNSMAHAYLLTGIRGVGKTTIARLMAMAVNCTAIQGGEPCGACESCQSITQGRNLDVQEMDAASHTGVEDIREILDGVRYPPVQLEYKVYIIDEAHMLSKSAFNALLKTLEEPPERVLFILATTESDKLPITVRSRCQRFDLRRLSVDEVYQYLDFVLSKEGVSAQKEALMQISRASDGSVRDALSLTERVLAYSGSQVAMEDVQAALGLIGPEIMQSISDAIAKGSAGNAVSTLRHAANQGYSPRAILLALSELWHELMCALVDPEWSDSENEWVQSSVHKWTEHELDLRYQVLVHGLRDLGLLDEQCGSEMILMRLAHLASLGSGSSARAPVAQPVAHSITPQKKTEQLTQQKPADVGPTDHRPEDIHKQLQSSIVSAQVSRTAEPPVVDEDDTASNKTAVEDVAPNESATNKTVSDVSGHTYPSWQAVLESLVKQRPEISALLEHVICAEFSPTKIVLLLEKYQLNTLTKQDREAFGQWLGCEVLWQLKGKTSNVVSMETVSQIRHREAENEQRRLWQEAESNPAVRLMTEKMGFRLTNVEKTDDLSQTSEYENSKHENPLHENE